VTTEEGSAVHCDETPFDNVESALEYVSCLLEACREARQQVETEIGRIGEHREARKKAALQLVSYKLERLTSHVDRSEHLLKDLRRLRRIILEDRGVLLKSASD
jgi:hypothetical protein